MQFVYSPEFEEWWDRGTKTSLGVELGTPATSELIKYRLSLLWEISNKTAREFAALKARVLLDMDARHCQTLRWGEV